MRLTILSDEAIGKIINHYWGETLDAVTELDRDICKAQAELTRKETLEELIEGTTVEITERGTMLYPISQASVILDRIAKALKGS